jgi:hypothetical protein
MGPRKAGEREMLESVYSMIALVFVLVACVELCDAATVVDVYRLIQYDISGVPFGSRLAALNHHAGSLHSAPGADLSRTVLIIPVRDLDISFVKGTYKVFQFFFLFSFWISSTVFGNDLWFLNA